MSSITTGGEYYAVYTYYTQTITEQQQLTAQMSASGIYEGAKMDASLQASINTFNSQTTTRVAFAQGVSGMANPTFPDSDHIIEYALAFPSQELTAPVVAGFTTEGYERVPKIGSNFDPIAANRDMIVGAGNKPDAGLTQSLVAIQQLEDQIGWLQSIYKFYGGYTDDKLSTVSDLAKKDHGAIDDIIVAYEKDPTQTFTVPDLTSLDYGSPVLQYTIAQSPGVGGGGGGAFDDVDRKTAVVQQCMVSGLQLRSGKRIDALIVTYTNMTSGETWTVKHGGGGGGLGPSIGLTVGQFVIHASGRSGEKVDALKLTTSNNQSVSGGGGGGGPFDMPVPSGAFVLGFAGRSGEELDQFKFVYGAFQPAYWIEPA